MAGDPFRFLTDWIRCSAPDRESIEQRLRGSVADIGSGAGSKIDPCSAISLRELNPALAVAVDQRFDDLRKGECRVRANVDGTPLPFRHPSFDAVVCTHVLEHVNQPAALLAHIFAIARPGGWAFIAVPNGWSFSDNLYKLWKFSFLVGKAEQIPHVQRFTRRSITALIREAGFEARYVARIGESFEWLSKHPGLRAVLNRLTRLLARLHEETFSYGWLFVVRKPA